jgi:hypothetical protein
MQYELFAGNSCAILLVFIGCHSQGQFIGQSWLWPLFRFKREVDNHLISGVEGWSREGTHSSNFVLGPTSKLRLWCSVQQANLNDPIHTTRAQFPMTNHLEHTCDHVLSILGLYSHVIYSVGQPVQCTGWSMNERVSEGNLWGRRGRTRSSNTVVS